MRKTLRTTIALALALLTAFLLPLQAIADTPEYISEIKIAMGDDTDEAAEDLEGYNILMDGDEYADINDEAGSYAGGKGDVAVLLGYKTTSDKAQAITDLAVMNMSGDFSYVDYQMMLSSKLQSQVTPMLDDFVTALKEYRANYRGKLSKNKNRARNSHDMLNMLVDDDTGMPLGDLLLNETKYEMGDAAYNKLSDSEKAEHADIETILLQSNGVAIATIENLIARAADTAETSWLERFQNLTYKKMVYETGLTPTDARKELNRLYYDDAVSFINIWKVFQKQITDYENNAALLKQLGEEDFEKYYETIEDFDMEDADEEQIEEFAKASVHVTEYTELMAKLASFIGIKKYLQSIPYDGATMYEFFSQPVEDIEKNITVLYPLIASLSDGQAATLEYLSLQDLIMMTAQSRKTYASSGVEATEPLSIYAGVDREAFKRGGIALTPDVRRDDISSTLESDKDALIFWNVVKKGNFDIFVQSFLEVAMDVKDDFVMPIVAVAMPALKVVSVLDKLSTYGLSSLYLNAFNPEGVDIMKNCFRLELSETAANFEKLTAASEAALWAPPMFGADKLEALLDGLTEFGYIVSLATSSYSLYELVHHYDIEYTPAPEYIYDKVSISHYNSKGEIISDEDIPVIYKACSCNRSEDAEYYEALGVKSDLNGDAGRQWLALYASKDAFFEPILADSLIVQYGNNNLPAGYKKGVHLFGTTGALDLNNKNYDWEHGRNGIFVFYKNGTAASIAGSGFTKGILAIVGFCSFAAGAVVTAACMTTVKRRKSEVTA